MSLKHTILGFLSFAPLSGYDLKKAFDRSVRHFWPADQSQIYRTLKQLHEAELIDQEVVEREDRLDMKIYGITPAGRQELLDWLATPLPASDTRDPFLIKIYFGFMLEEVDIVALLQREIDQIDALIQEYVPVYHEVTGQEISDAMKRPLFYSMLTLEFGIRANLWFRDWLQNIKTRIESGDFDVMPLEDMLGQSPI